MGHERLPGITPRKKKGGVWGGGGGGGGGGGWGGWWRGGDPKSSITVDWKKRSAPECDLASGGSTMKKGKFSRIQGRVPRSEYQ